MKHTCGNYYINDKSTGSVVGQQPFGGSGKSGTNDKAGDINFIYRLINQKNIKKSTYFDRKKKKFVFNKTNHSSKYKNYILE